MTRNELLAALERAKVLAEEEDAETAHYDADYALLAYIGDEGITQAWNAITPKWWA